MVPRPRLLALFAATGLVAFAAQGSPNRKQVAVLARFLAKPGKEKALYAKLLVTSATALIR